MLDDRIVPSDLGCKALLLPDERASPAFLWMREIKAYPRGVAFALEAIESTSTALEAYLLRLAQADAISGLVGTACELLCRIAINMISNPGSSGIGRIRMEGIFGEPILSTKLREYRITFLFLCFGKGTCLLPARIVTHVLEPFHGFPKQSVIQTTCCFKVRSQMVGLLAIYLQRQFQKERGRFTFFAHTHATVLETILSVSIPH